MVLELAAAPLEAPLELLAPLALEALLELESVTPLETELMEASGAPLQQPELEAVPLLELELEAP